MSLDDLVERDLGPFAFRTHAQSVADFVEATSDDPARWARTPPPGYAAAALFVGAAPFLEHPEITEEARMMLHADQSFLWRSSFELETDYEAWAKLVRLRRRHGVSFARLETSVRADGAQVLEAQSTFLLSGGDPPAGQADEETEPDPHERSERDIANRETFPGLHQQLQPLRKSASRADLVRYAAATRDWNPIHWDHWAAVEAGLSGVVCHGLLMAAWVIQAAARIADGSVPVSEARLRFKAPLRPAVPVIASGTVTSHDEGLALLDMKLSSRMVDHVEGTVSVRTR